MNCPHTRKTIVLTPELKHHGKEICTTCRSFLVWIKKPVNVERDERNVRWLAALQKLQLSAWEKDFIGSLSESGPKFSPKQQAVLDKLAAKYSL